MANLATAEEDLEDGLPQMGRNAKRPLDRDSYQSSADSTGYSEGTSPSESPPRAIASESPSPSETSSSMYRGGSPLYGGSSSSLSSSTVAGLAAGPKFKLLHEGDVQVCRVNRPRTVFAKILSSKLLRRWETHHLILGGRRISSRTPTGFMEEAIAYSHIENLFVESSWDASQKFCIRVAIPDGFVYIQANNAYLRDQWLHSIHWKRNVYKYQNLLMSTRRMEVLIKELKSMVELSMMAPLQDECIHQVPLEIVSKMLSKAENTLPKAVVEDVVNALVPLLEKSHPTPEICDFFSQHCKGNPRSSLVTSLFTPVVQRILKHNMDFGKYPRMRIFVQDYILALNSHNDGHIAVQTFIQSTHGPASSCPHPRVLLNLVSISLAAVYSLFEQHRNSNLEQINNVARRDLEFDEHLRCFITTFVIMSSFEDWRPCLAQLLQPIPFPDEALANSVFNTSFKPVIRNIGTDRRCDVHLMVLGMREGKEGWFHVYCPGSIACDDEGQLWSEMLKTLVSCCCRRKAFLQSLNKMMGSVMLLALRDDVTCQEVISAMLELQVVDNEDNKLQMVTTLQSTTNGKREYAALCDRQMHLKELQQKGGPKKLTLPSRSTDADLAKLLSCGSFGNLECLSLAFTHVTSACADQLIKLPSLRYLNLWSTQFGDAGLQLISEHLHKLQVLNLCETPVTDKGLASLASMKNLRKLNLNSTSLSAHTFEGLKQKLPALQECDVRYTDAW